MKELFHIRVLSSPYQARRNYIHRGSHVFHAITTDHFFFCFAAD